MLCGFSVVGKFLSTFFTLSDSKWFSYCFILFYSKFDDSPEDTAGTWSTRCCCCPVRWTTLNWNQGLFCMTFWQKSTWWLGQVDPALETSRTHTLVLCCLLLVIILMMSKLTIYTYGGLILSSRLLFFLVVSLERLCGFISIALNFRSCLWSHFD